MQSNFWAGSKNLHRHKNILGPVKGQGISSFGIGCWIRRTRWVGNFSTIYLQNVVSLVVSDHAPCTPDLKDTSKVRQDKSLDHLSSFCSTGVRAYNGTTKFRPYTHLQEF